MSFEHGAAGRPSRDAGAGEAVAAGMPTALFDVPDRRALRRRLATAFPGMRTALRRGWTPEPPLRRRRLAVWRWDRDEAALGLAAPRLLREFVLPLLARRFPCCIAFPFGADVFARRPLDFAEVVRLDLEDIGALLCAGTTVADGWAPAAREVAGAGLAAAGTGAGAAAGRRAACLAELDARQRAAVVHAVGPARVLAPAGSGKTKTLVSRVVQLVDRGVDPGAILMLAFNRKAAEQLEERLDALGIATTRRMTQQGTAPGDDAARDGRRAAVGAVHCATFNAFGARYQREVAGAPVVLGDERDLHRLMRRAVVAAAPGLAPGGCGDAAATGDVSRLTAACLDALTRVRAGLESPETTALAGAEHAGGDRHRGRGRGRTTAADRPAPATFAPVHDEYLRLQRQAGVQSFDDQIYFCLADMLAQPDHRALVQRRYAHVLVDEFQDLNPAQLLLVDLLSRPRRDLFVVGDDDQLIYGWRLADIDGILGFHERMPPRPWSATYLLATNYRCAREVVATSDRLIRHNRRRESKRIRPREGAADGAVRFAGGPSHSQRVAAVVAFLRDERARLGCEWRALAVLCRYRAQQLPLALALDRAGIPRGPVEGGRLFSHPAAMLVRDCLARVLAPPCRVDDPRTAAVRRRLGVAAASAAPGRPPDATGHAGAGGPAGAISSAGAADAVWAVAEEFRLGERWRAEAASGDRGAAAGAADDPYRVFDALLMLADEQPLPEFLTEWDRLAADEQARQREDAGDAGPQAEMPDADGVAIGTIHAAKGREYRSVAIPDYWCDLRHLTPAQLEEERRVLYVAVTRAQEAALLTIDTSRGEVHAFLRELGAPPVVTSGDTSHDASLPSPASPP